MDEEKLFSLADEHMEQMREDYPGMEIEMLSRDEYLILYHSLLAMAESDRETLEQVSDPLVTRKARKDAALEIPGLVRFTEWLGSESRFMPLGDAGDGVYLVPLPEHWELLIIPLLRGSAILFGGSIGRIAGGTGNAR